MRRGCCRRHDAWRRSFGEGILDGEACRRWCWRRRGIGRGVGRGAGVGVGDAVGGGAGGNVGGVVVMFVVVGIGGVLLKALKITRK